MAERKLTVSRRGGDVVIPRRVNHLVSTTRSHAATRNQPKSGCAGFAEQETERRSPPRS